MNCEILAPLPGVLDNCCAAHVEDLLDHIELTLQVINADDNSGGDSDDEAP